MSLDLRTLTLYPEWLPCPRWPLHSGSVDPVGTSSIVATSAVTHRRDAETRLVLGVQYPRETPVTYYDSVAGWSLAHCYFVPIIFTRSPCFIHSEKKVEKLHA